MMSKQTKNSTFFRNKYFIAIIFLLSLFTVVAAINAYITYKISMEGSFHLLETRATDIAVNLGFSLERLGLNPDLFADLVSSDRWEYLAFLALVDKDFICILHSNQKLIGRKMEDDAIKKVFRQERIITHFERLATGEMVFILDFPLKLHIGDVNKIENDATFSVTGQGRVPTLKQIPKLKVFCLRVALHPYPAFSIERKAKFQLAVTSFAIILLWLLAIFFIRAWMKNYQLEKSLAEKEQMAALGQMAAVLAHEIRNPLSTIKGFAQIYMEDKENPALKEDMEIIVEQVKRLERLTSNLLVYAKPTKLYVEHFSLNEFCQEIRRFLPSILDDITLEIDCKGEEVSADKGKLLQVIINLVQNSIEALKDYDGNKKIYVNILALDSGIKIIVEDSGPGFNEKTKDKILQPFFTTKTKGTGLGLAIVKRLIKAMNGTLRLGKSDLGGAKVEIEIKYPDEE